MEIRPDFVWPRLEGKDAKNKPGPWTPVKEFCNYKTAYEYGFPKVAPPPFFVELTDRLKCENPREVERDVLLSNYATTYKTNHDWKYVVLEPINQNYLPPFGKFNFLKEFDEKFKTRLPRERIKLTEYKEKYPKYNEENLNGVLCDLKKRMFCPLKGLTRDDVKKIDVSDFGYGKYLDIYLSTSHLDYVHHKPERVDKYKNTEVFVKPAFTPRSKELKMIDKGAESIQRTFTYENPLLKSCSETIAKFQVPKPMVDPKVDCFVPKIRQTIGDVVATPGMYHTEYSHIGHNWSVQSLIPRRKPLPLKQLRYLDHLEKIKSVR